MSKLLATVPPRLPVAPTEYERRFQDQHSDVLRLYFNQTNAIQNALIGTDGATYVQSPHGMFMSDQDQANAGVTSENLVTYNQSVISQSVEVRSGYQLWFKSTGQYLITFSLQFTNRGNAPQEIEVWAKLSTANYPLSNTRFDIAARKSADVWAHTVAAVTGIFTVEDPDVDYLAIAWWSNGADVFLEHYAAGTNPARPAIPSVILTAQYVSRLP